MEEKVREASQIARELRKEAEGMSARSFSRAALLEEASGLECFVADVQGEAAMHRRDVPCLPKAGAHHKWVVCTWPGCAWGGSAFVMRIGARGCYTGHASLGTAHEREVRAIEGTKSSSGPVA